MLTADDLAMAMAVEVPGGDDGALDAATNNGECGVEGGVKGGPPPQMNGLGNRHLEAGYNM